MCRRTSIPARRAASALPPIANVRRPKVVRLSINQPTATTTPRIRTSSGMPSTSLRAMSLMDCWLTICVRLSASFAASPRALTSIASVTMNGTSRP